MLEQSITNRNKVTEMLRDWRTDNAAISDADKELQLSPILYDSLNRISHKYIAKEKQGYTLQATDLVHEAFESLVDIDINWESRKHFYAIAAKTIRRLLIDRAREKNAIKRGGGCNRITFDESSISGDEKGDDILALDESLIKLKAQDQRKATIIELHFYAGLTYQEIGLYMNVSEATVDRDLRFAKAWLANDMKS